MFRVGWCLQSSLQSAEGYGLTCRRNAACLPACLPALSQSLSQEISVRRLGNGLLLSGLCLALSFINTVAGTDTSDRQGFSSGQNNVCQQFTIKKTKTREVSYRGQNDVWLLVQLFFTVTVLFRNRMAQTCDKSCILLRHLFCYLWQIMSLPCAGV